MTPKAIASARIGAADNASLYISGRTLAWALVLLIGGNSLLSFLGSRLAPQPVTAAPAGYVTQQDLTDLAGRLDRKIDETALRIERKIDDRAPIEARRR